MLYFFLKPLVQIAIKVYFRHIYISGRENIPSAKPFIIALNHPSAFLEPVIMAANLKKPVHFLVRGDHFNKSFYCFLLEQGKMIPVFRQKESGFGSLKNNFDTFSRCYEYIEKGEIVALFPEGRTENEKKLRPLQRGIARIAFGTLFQFPELEDLYILPIGVNYSEPLLFRGTAMLHIGEPMSVRSYMKNIETPDYKQLLIDLELNLKKNMVIIEKETDEKLIEFCLMMSRNLKTYPFLPVYGYQDNRLRIEQNVSSFWNFNAPDSLKIEMGVKIDSYSSLLIKWNIDDKVVLSNDKPHWVTSIPIFSILSFLGYIFASPPAIFAEWISENKVNHLSFKSPVRFGVGFGAYLVYALLFCILASIISIWIIPATILMGFNAYFSLFYREKQAYNKSYKRFYNLTVSEKIQLISLKQEILSSFI